MFGETPLVLVESPEALARCAEQLARARVIGVDTESDSMHHYREKVCLIQVSDLHTDFVIDPLRVPDLSPLNEIFANRDQVKVFHGADYDVVCLKRDFGFKMQGIFDTMVAAQFLGLPRFGLADLIHTWWGWTLDKRLQRHDWAARPLLDEHLDYARGDSHWLPALRDIFIQRLTRCGRLDHVLEECEALEGREWQRPRHDPADFYRVKGAKQLDLRGQHVLSAVYRYRDARAAEQDRPAYKVLPDEILWELSSQRPESMEALLGMFRRGAPFLRRHGDGLLAAVLAGLVSEDPLPTVAEAAKREPGLRGQRAERLMGALKDWRNREVSTKGVQPVAVVSNNALKELVRVAPRSLEELAAVPELRKWQVECYGPLWLEIVAGVLGPERAAGSVDLAESPSPGRRRRGRREGRGPAEPVAEGWEERTGDEPTA